MLTSNTAPLAWMTAFLSFGIENVLVSPLFSKDAFIRWTIFFFLIVFSFCYSENVIQLLSSLHGFWWKWTINHIGISLCDDSFSSCGFNSSSSEGLVIMYLYVCISLSLYYWVKPSKDWQAFYSSALVSTSCLHRVSEWGKGKRLVFWMWTSSLNSQEYMEFSK